MLQLAHFVRWKVCKSREHGIKAKTREHPLAYQDSNPERRNLTVLSLCIIIFYLAGGAFLSNEVRLQVINVKF